MILSNKNQTLEVIKEIEFTSEKELQTVCENNLETLLNLEFIATEFSVSTFRLDTLAYDKESNSLVIIEYKNRKNSSVIDQGYSYLSVMFNYKANFILEYSKKVGRVLNIEDINWEQSKVIFVSPHFTNYQMNSINFKDLPIELWKIKKYNNDIISFDQIKPVNAVATINDISPIKDNVINNVVPIVKSYTEQDHTSLANESILDIYNSLKEFIMGEDEDIVLKVTKVYVGFYKNRKCLVSIKIQKSSLIVWINEKFGIINDDRALIKDVSNIGHHGNGECQIHIANDDNIGYIQDIIRKFIESKR